MYKALLVRKGEISSFNAFNVATLDGNLLLFDANKLIKLSSLETEYAFVDCQFWKERKMFLSSSVNGEIYLNGFGSQKDHVQFPITGGDPLNDFKVVDENYVLFATEDSFVYLFDIRKGIINN